jgi:hypothetical protein
LKLAHALAGGKATLLFGTPEDMQCCLVVGVSSTWIHWWLVDNVGMHNHKWLVNNVGMHTHWWLVDNVAVQDGL